MAERLGVTPEQCVGLRCYEVVHGTPQPPEFCPHAHTCQDGREHIAEVDEPRLGGHFLVSTTPRFDEQGRLIGTVHVARDITARKQDEEEREIAAGFLRLVNESRGKDDLIRAAVIFFQEKSAARRRHPTERRRRLSLLRCSWVPARVSAVGEPALCPRRCGAAHP